MIDNAKMTRTFIGIKLSGNALKEIKNFKNTLKTHLTCSEGKFRWNNAQNLHVTLFFIGEIKISELRKTEQAIEELINMEKLKSFSLSYLSCGLFSRKDKPNVFWVGVEKTPELMKLQEKIKSKMSEIGFKSEKRNYKPHVTLFRVKKINFSGSKKLTQILNSHKTIDFGKSDISEIYLYESKQTPEGSRYFPMKKFDLL